MIGKIPWRRERLSIPVFWPGELHGLCSPWGCKESDTIEQLSLQLSLEQFAVFQDMVADWAEDLLCTLRGGKRGPARKARGRPEQKAAAESEWIPSYAYQARG